MKCKKCGSELKENWNICPICNTPIVGEKKNIIDEASQFNDMKEDLKEDSSNNETNNDNADDKAYIYIIVFLINIGLGILVEELGIICFLIALFTIVAAYIRYPKNKIIKVLFLFFLVLIVLYMVYIILLLFLCHRIVSECGYSCR